jgi:hypothetical protein
MQRTVGPTSSSAARYAAVALELPPTAALLTLMPAPLPADDFWAGRPAAYWMNAAHKFQLCSTIPGTYVQHEYAQPV